MRKKKPALNPCRPATRRARKPGAVARNAYRFTPARRAALAEARKKRRFEMTPPKWAAVRKAAEANRRNFRLTPARLKSMGVNIRKAQAGSVRKFRMTETRRQALLGNLEKAWAKPPSPEARSRHNRLKHGLQSRNFERTLRPFGENPAEFQAHLKALERTFDPRDDEERALVKSIAEAIWLRCRLFRAQTRWVAARLKRALHALRRDPHPDAKTTEQCAVQVMGALLEDDWIYSADDRLLRRVERRLKALVRKRQGGEAEFSPLDDTPDPELAELDKTTAESRLWQRMLEGVASRSANR